MCYLLQNFVPAVLLCPYTCLSVSLTPLCLLLRVPTANTLHHHLAACPSALPACLQDSQDPNPLIRALAVRTMGCIRVDKITEYLCDPLHRCLKVAGWGGAGSGEGVRPVLRATVTVFWAGDCEVAAGQGTAVQFAAYCTAVC